MKNILVIEDDPITLKILAATLDKHGFAIIKATTGKDALALMGKYEIQAVILDLNLPDMNGMDILRQLRNHPVIYNVATIIVTENDDKLEAILGLEMGADDYITKPFHQRELIARLNTVLRRTRQAAANTGANLIFDELHIDLKKRAVRLNNLNIDLSFKEFEILTVLASNAGEALTRETIMDTIGGVAYNPETRTVDMHIAAIRKKLDDSGSKRKYIDTVSGVGYRFRR